MTTPTRLSATVRRSGLGLLLSIIFGLALAASARAAAQPIEGTWNFGNGQVLVQAQPNGGYVGTVAQPVSFAGCTHAEGQAIWGIQGSGTSYTGTHVWLETNHGCQDDPFLGKASWAITSTGTTYTLTFCTAEPGSGAPNPSATPANSPYEGTYCYDLTRALSPAQTPPAPVNQVAPEITGTATVAQTVGCEPGTWTNAPGAFDYAWSQDGAAIAGASGATLTIPAAAAGKTLTCTVTAFNGGVASAPATSPGVAVLAAPSSHGTTGFPPGRASCLAAAGAVGTRRLGLASLGQTRARVRSAYRGTTRHAGRLTDTFCLRGGALLARYRATVRRVDGRRLTVDRVQWLTSTNAHFRYRTVRVGSTIATVRVHLHPGAPVRRGRTEWYFVHLSRSDLVLRVRGNVVTEIGIVERSLSQTAAERATLSHHLS